MKKIFLSIVLLLSVIKVMAQTEVMREENGFRFSYTRAPAGTIENPQTGTKFTRYKITTQLKNSTGKEMVVVKASVNCRLTYDKKDLNEADLRFCAERNTTGPYHGQLCKFNILCG